ncbi:hypothetical protein QNH36_15235 [Mesobacillus sp. AQ2]|jgi:hypothetical protein|uniref:hypothetical protein n=1 Tax=Bacillaceae TaxID=186817 RepID=UPI0011A84E13|nr:MULTISPECIES: hypothetical protein [Bacillaceae]MCM3122114.1 hypothetical protein [Mesobacillus sp. MER 33]MCM3232078.1 hypothetical protein [Mesobacillus sp. MER 48]WHX39033.1 hypothetical protein QNH36_15235 [Mesobacillus sp. AQ2]
MYRFSIGDEDWIIIFSPHLSLEQKEKEEIIRSIAIMGPQWAAFSHGESFVIFQELVGAIVVRIEKVPSLILTVSAVVHRDRWYINDNNKVEPFDIENF